MQECLQMTSKEIWPQEIWLDLYVSFETFIKETGAYHDLEIPVKLLKYGAWEGFQKFTGRSREFDTMEEQVSHKMEHQHLQATKTQLRWSKILRKRAYL